MTTAARPAWGWGLATTTDAGDVLDVWYPAPALGSPEADAVTPAALLAAQVADDIRGVRTEVDEITRHADRIGRDTGGFDDTERPREVLGAGDGIPDA